jgi:hypothetical protein
MPLIPYRFHGGAEALPLPNDNILRAVTRHSPNGMLPVNRFEILGRRRERTLNQAFWQFAHPTPCQCVCARKRYFVSGDDFVKLTRVTGGCRVLDFGLNFSLKTNAKSTEKWPIPIPIYEKWSFDTAGQTVGVRLGH